MISEYDSVDFKEWCSWTLGYGWSLKGYYDAVDIPIYLYERFYVVYGEDIIVIGDINGAIKLYKYPIIDIKNIVSLHDNYRIIDFNKN